MNPLRLLAAIALAFGAIASAGLLALWLKEFRSRGVQWFGPAGAFALLYCAAWFALSLAITAGGASDAR